MRNDAKEWNPYVGARPFERNKKDRERFFGRDHETLQIISLVFGHPIVLVYAQSGAGKTSLFNTKVAPALEEHGFDVFPLARIRGIVPTGITPKNLYVFNLLAHLKEGNESKNIQEGTLAVFLKDLPRKVDVRGKTVPRVIVCDQFEELFEIYPEGWREQRAEFFQQVTEAVAADPLLRIVFLIREDYVAQLDPFARFLPEGFRPHFRLERLRREAALIAITGPLCGTEYSYGEGVAEYLVENLMKIRIEARGGEGVQSEEVSGEFVDPMQLQVVCLGLWKKVSREGVQVIPRTYVGDVDQALAEFYEQAVNEASSITGTHQYELRLWCKANLITSTGTRSLIHKEPKETAGIRNDALEILRKSHLINQEWRAGAYWYELTHDRLIEPIRTSNEKWLSMREKKSQRASAQIQQGDEAFRSGELNAAIDIYKEVLKTCEEIADRWGATNALFNMGRAYQATGKNSEAKDAYQRTLVLVRAAGYVPNIVQLLNVLGEVNHTLEDFTEAIQCLSEAIVLAPNQQSIHARRAAAYWYSCKYDEALADYTKELEFNADSLSVLNGRGQVLAEMGKYEEALADLERAIGIDGSGRDTVLLAYMRNGRGLALGGLGRYSEALNEFEASIKASGENAWAYFNRALTFERMGARDKAVSDYRLSLKKNDPKLSPLKVKFAKLRLMTLGASLE